MNSIIKQQWCEALRSKKYEQGEAVLLDTDGKMCCLGVLTDLYIKETGKLQWHEDKYYEETVYPLVNDTSFLPLEVRNWAGFTKEEYEIKDYDNEGDCDIILKDKTHLTHHNDGYTNKIFYINIPRKSFEEIADLIEGNL